MNNFGFSFPSFQKMNRVVPYHLYSRESSVIIYCIELLTHSGGLCNWQDGRRQPHLTIPRAVSQ